MDIHRSQDQRHERRSMRDGSLSTSMITTIYMSWIWGTNLKSSIEPLHRSDPRRRLNAAKRSFCPTTEASICSCRSQTWELGVSPLIDQSKKLSEPIEGTCQQGQLPLKSKEPMALWPNRRKLSIKAEIVVSGKNGLTLYATNQWHYFTKTRLCENTYQTKQSTICNNVTSNGRSLSLITSAKNLTKKKMPSA